MTHDFGAFMANLQIYFMSWTMSMTRSFLKAFMNNMSPMAPSVMAGQKTGISFLQHQQYMDSGLFISFPILWIMRLGVHRYPFYFCSLYMVLNRGFSHFQNLTQFSAGTRIFPILHCSFFLLSVSSMLKSPAKKSLKHFTKSSSTPPPLVTMQSIILCWARYLMVYLMPDETMLEVYPRKILHLVFFLYSGSDVSSSSCQVRGSSLSLQSMASLTILMESARLLAWSPVEPQELNIFWQSTPWLKSYPLIGAPVGISPTEQISHLGSSTLLLFDEREGAD